MTHFRQTWWNHNLPSRFDEFKTWIGGKDALSKVFCRKMIKNAEYKSLADFGCGTATEFFGYKEEYPELKYLGIDSCTELVHRNRELEVPMLNASVEDTLLPDGSYEVAFGRHILEHQPSAEPTLNEMIRVASRVAMHVFFMKPRHEPEAIGYDPAENLYHNRYDIGKIEKFLEAHPDVSTFDWLDLSDAEMLLVIYKK